MMTFMQRMQNISRCDINETGNRTEHEKITGAERDWSFVINPAK
jgi:hypothetical protein